ncbi:MAG: CdaR family protein [Bacteroidota bacterium]
MSYIIKNWKVVIISLIGATTFWFFNALNKNYDANINYPVEFVFSRDSNVIMQPLPSTIRINVSSGGWNLLRKTFWFNVPPLEIPLEQPSAVRFIDRTQLFPFVVNQMSELKVNHIVSDSLFLFIEPKDTKRVALNINQKEVPLRSDYRITSPIRFEPDSITLSGPSSFIDTLKAYYTLNLNMENIDDPVNQDIPVNLPSGLIKSDPQQVRISFNVEEFIDEQITVPLELAGFPADSSKYPEISEVVISYKVASSKRRDFNPSEFIVLLDISTLDPRDSTVMPLLLFYPLEITDPVIETDEIHLIYE